MESVSVRGTGVVAGIAFAPAAWTRPAIAPPPPGPPLDEPDREAEAERFLAAATTVADRFTQRASSSTGVASEVLGATAALARDRGWLRAAKKLIAAGASAESATDQAIEGFVAQLVNVISSAGQSVQVTGNLRAGQQVATGSVIALKAAWLGKSGSN